MFASDDLLHVNLSAQFDYFSDGWPKKKKNRNKNERIDRNGHWNATHSHSTPCALVYVPTVKTFDFIRRKRVRSHESHVLSQWRSSALFVFYVRKFLDGYKRCSQTKRLQQVRVDVRAIGKFRTEFRFELKCRTTH